MGRHPASAVASAIASGSFGSLARASANQSSNKAKGSVRHAFALRLGRGQAATHLVDGAVCSGMGANGMDLYQRLGVKRGASEAEIKKAYRSLAKQLHPDRNKDNPNAAKRFGEVTAAYDLLSDKDKRARYDRGEIDEEGNPKMPFGSGFGGFRRGARPQRGGGFEGFPGGFRPATRPTSATCSKGCSAAAADGVAGGFGGFRQRLNRRRKAPISPIG